MSFNYVGSVNGAQRNLETVLLGDSQTFNVGDVIESYVTGKGDTGVAATPVLGVIHAFVDQDLQALESPTPTAGVASGTAVTTVTTGAANITIQALVDTSIHSKYSATVNGTIGTTVDSELRGARLDVNSAGGNAGELLETTATRTVATPANFYSEGVDSNDAERLIVQIALSEKRV